MPRYYVNSNPQDSGEHEVHVESDPACEHAPIESNRIDLGFHFSCEAALHKAEIERPDWKANGCYYCCKDCHTS